MLNAGARVEGVWTETLKEIRGNDTGTIFNLVTLLFIMALWLANIIKGWKESLPKYLSVKFYYVDENKKSRIYEGDLGSEGYVFLTSEADIRSLAQQIGKQNNPTKRLNKNLELDSTGYLINKSLLFDAVEEKWRAFWHYDVEVRLSESLKKTENTENEKKRVAQVKAAVQEKQFKDIEAAIDAVNAKLAAIAEKNIRDSEDEFKKEVRAALLELKFTPKGGWK